MYDKYAVIDGRTITRLQASPYECVRGLLTKQRTGRKPKCHG